MDDEHIQLVRHIVGNNVAHAAIYHHGESHRTSHEIRTIQARVVEHLEEKVAERGITDNGLLGVLTALKKYDWGDAASYATFRTVYDAYVAPVESEAQRARDEIWKNRR